MVVNNQISDKLAKRMKSDITRGPELHATAILVLGWVGGQIRCFSSTILIEILEMDYFKMAAFTSFHLVCFRLSWGDYLLSSLSPW